MWCQYTLKDKQGNVLTKKKSLGHIFEWILIPEMYFKKHPDDKLTLEYFEFDDFGSVTQTAIIDKNTKQEDIHFTHWG